MILIFCIYKIILIAYTKLVIKFFFTNLAKKNIFKTPKKLQLNMPTKEGSFVK